jgi:hypothetical protein
LGECDVGIYAQDSKFKIQNSRFETGDRIQDSRFKIQNSRYKGGF